MKCYACCTAFSYEIKSIFDLFHSMHVTEKIDRVLHVAYQGEGHHSELFFFPYGTVVSWNLPLEELEKILVTIRPFENDPLEKNETEKYHYKYGESALFENEEITLPNHEFSAKLAFSHGLAQSAKLGAFETITQKTFEKNKHLPENLARFGKIPLSRLQIRKKIGQLFLDRSSINLHLDVLDTPEFFWDHPDYEPLYKRISNELDLSSRTAALNQQLGVLHDLFEMLNNELSVQHSSRLEWAIIILIISEVLLVLFHDVLRVI